MSPALYTGVDNLEVMREAKKYNRFLIDLILDNAPVHARSLDFGAGAGTFAAPVAKRGLDVVALEPDDHLRALVEAQGIHTAADIEQLQPQSFNYIYSLNVLEHIENDVEVLMRLHTRLAQGGTLLIYVPAFPILFSSMDVKVKHVRRYTRLTLARAVTSAGFQIEKLAYVDSLGFFASLAFKAFDNGRGDIDRSALRAYDRFVLPLSFAIDRVMQKWFGKNLLLVARKLG
jgi:SAM-dependent methyltransferase